MREIFMCVLSLSLSGALTGLLLLAIRPVTERIFSRRWNYYIWLLVIARLIIPIYFQSPFSFVMTGNKSPVLREMAEGMALTPAREPADSQTDIPAQEEIPDIPVNAREQPFLQPQKRITPKNPEVLLGILWLLGAGISLFLKLKNYLCFTRAVKKDCVPVSDARLADMVKELSQKLSVRKQPALYAGKNVSVPITLGLKNPRIVLPGETWELKDLQMVLHHELIHIKRKDLWYKWAYQALLCIHWFNPVLYLIGIKLNIDCELSCDEAVLTALTREGRKAYGNVLINTAQKNVKPVRNIPSTTLLERKEDLKMRLKGIIHYKKTGGLRKVISICLSGFLLLLSACGSIQTEPGAIPMHLSTAAGYASFWDEAAAEYVSFWDTLGSFLGDRADTGLEDFLNKPVLADQQSEAWKAYDDDSLTAGNDISDQWHMHSYMGGGQRIKCDGMYLNGTASVRIIYAQKDAALDVDSAYEITAGRFKIVHVNPEGEVSVINETGKSGSFTVNIKAGRNVIKFVGQGAKIKNLLLEHSDLERKNGAKVYHSETEEQSEILTAEIKEGKVDKEKLMKLLYYLDDDTVSEAFALLLKQGAELTGEELTDLIIYSDSDLSALYLGEAIKNGKIDRLGEDIVIDMAPYIGGERLRDLLLATGGKISDETLCECAPYLGPGRLREVLLASDQISYELICNCASYLGSSGLEAVLEKYLKDGGEITYSQFAELYPYLGDSALKRLDESGMTGKLRKLPLIK